MELCEHGNSYHCQSCEVKQLKYVIEELKSYIDHLEHERQLLHGRLNQIISLAEKEIK